MSDYKPRAGSLAEKVVEFFVHNRDEELTRHDIANKFDTSPSSIDTCLRPATDAGVLAIGNDETLTRVWKAGPQLPQVSGFKAWLAKKGQKSAEGATRAVPLPPPSTLIAAIEPGVPLPTPKPRGAEFHQVWEAMQAGDSVPVDTELAKRLISNAQAWGKAHGRKFITRQVEGGGSRIWRTE